MRKTLSIAAMLLCATNAAASEVDLIFTDDTDDINFDLSTFDTIQVNATALCYST